MKNLKLSFLCISLIFSIYIYGQVKPVEEKPFIEITGTAEKEIIPNEIYIRIVIRERYVNKEKISIEVQEEKLKAAIRNLGINMDNLSLSDANADYVKVRRKTNDVLTKKDYTLKVNTAALVGQVFQQLDRLEITDADVTRVNHTKMDSLKKEARIMAIKAAKEKADYLLNAIGEQTGKPIVINENSYVPINYNLRNMKAESNVLGVYASDSMMNEEEEIQFQKIKIEASVYVKFLIK